MKFSKEPAVSIFRQKKCVLYLTENCNLLKRVANIWTGARNKPEALYEHVPGPRRGRAV
jgi:hypothetical protein